MIRGKFLPPGLAKRQFIEFWKQYAGSSQPLGVCYKLAEIKDFITKTEQMFIDKKTPEDQRGVALMMGIHLDQSSSHAKNKPTVMLVATQFADNPDPTAGQVDSINNPIIKAGWPTVSLEEPFTALDVPGDIDDVAYDAGALWP